MKLLLAYGFNFKRDKEENIYAYRAINNDLFERYSKLSDNLTILSDFDKKEYNVELLRKSFNTIKTANKKIVEVPNLYSSNYTYLNPTIRHKIDKIIEKSVIESDAIIVRVPSLIGYKVAKFAKKHNKPYLVEIVGCTWDSLWNHSTKGKLIAFSNYLSMRKSVKEAPFALYVTNMFLQHRYPNNGVNIGCSDVALLETNNQVLEQRLKKINEMTETQTIVLGTTAAVNVRYKGQQYVIKAISKLNKEGYNFEYHLVGGGDNSYLKAMAKKYKIEDKVKFLGTYTHKEVFDYLDMIDVYIQPSKTEGLPRSLVEAMSRGCPSLGSNVGGIPELLEKNNIFKKNSSKEIYVLLKHINRESLMNEAKHNFKKAQEYNKDVLNKKREAFYKDFIDKVRMNLI